MSYNYDIISLKIKMEENLIMKFKKIVALGLICSLIAQPLTGFAAFESVYDLSENQKSQSSEKNFEDIEAKSVSTEFECEDLEKLLSEIDNNSLETKTKELKKLKEEIENENSSLKSKNEKFKSFKEKIESKNSSIKAEIKKLEKIQSELDFESKLRKSKIEDLKNQSKKLERSIENIEKLINEEPTMPPPTQAGLLEVLGIWVTLSFPFLGFFVISPYFSTLANRSFDSIASYFNSTKS